MIGQVLGDYTILKKIGSGCFGEVYLAEHRFLKKKTAVKILDKELSSDQSFIERFEKDIGILSTLDHPSIVKVHNISFADDRYFIVMDAVVDREGNSQHLGKYLQKKGKYLTESALESILRQIASALDYAHRLKLSDEGLIHRGLKFTNILVDEKEKNLRIYLTDFGFSRLIGDKKTFQKLLKGYLDEMNPDDEILYHSFHHHFSFLSPEQKKGRVSPASDTYSFGVLAYYLLIRDYPEGYFELPSKIVPEYQLNWDLLLSKCLSKDPDKRPQMLTEMMNSTLSSDSDNYSLDVLSWNEVEKKVESAMQMSFEFSNEETTYEDEIFEEKEEETPKPIIRPQEIQRPEYEPDPGAIFQKELNVSFYQPQKVEVREVEPIFTEMVIIPGGNYERGSYFGPRDESPKHKISLTSFALDIHPVTNEQFVRFLEAMGGEKDSNNNDIIRLKDSRIKRTGGKLMIESGYAKHPVVGITWYGAHAYAKWIGKRLPTEAEWEIASLGGHEEATYPTGNDIDRTQANFFNSDTTVVISYPSNGYGLFDMVGNVYEWCRDWYAYNYYDTSLQEPENPQGPPQGVYRVLRGGCWKSLKEDLRCAHRHRNNPGTVNGAYGFRCAADVS